MTFLLALDAKATAFANSKIVMRTDAESIAVYTLGVEV
jgi:hypothetical protein